MHDHANGFVLEFSFYRNGLYACIIFHAQIVYHSVSLENATQLLENVYALLDILEQTAV